MIIYLIAIFKSVFIFGTILNDDILPSWFLIEYCLKIPNILFGCVETTLNHHLSLFWIPMNVFEKMENLVDMETIMYYISIQGN